MLKPGGHLLLSAPHIWGLHEIPHDYFRFTCYGLQHLAERAGLEVLEVRPMAGYWVTAGARFCYYLRRFQRRLFGPLMGPVYALIQCTAWALDRLHRVDSDTWNYLLVARRPERALASRPLMGVLLLALALRIGTAIAFDGRTSRRTKRTGSAWQNLYGKADCKARKPVFSDLHYTRSSSLASMARWAMNRSLCVCYRPCSLRLPVFSKPFALARSAYGERAGLYAALLTACHPLFIFFSGLFMAETLLLLCTGLALWCVQRVVNQSNVPESRCWA